MDGIGATTPRGAWNKDKLVGQKAPFKLQEIWAIRIRLQMQGRVRDLALFDLGIDSKLRAWSASTTLAGGRQLSWPVAEW